MGVGTTEDSIIIYSSIASGVRREGHGVTSGVVGDVCLVVTPVQSVRRGTAGNFNGDDMEGVGHAEDTVIGGVDAIAIESNDGGGSVFIHHDGHAVAGSGTGDGGVINTMVIGVDDGGVVDAGVSEGDRIEGERGARLGQLVIAVEPIEGVVCLVKGEGDGTL